MPTLNYPSWEIQRDLYYSWGQFQDRFPWEWFVTVSFRDAARDFTALNFFKQWRLRIIDDEKLQLAGFLMLSRKNGRLHIHALMLGKNRHGKTLQNCSRRSWENEMRTCPKDSKPSWKRAWRKNFPRIKPVTSNFGVCDYMARHNLDFRSDYPQTDVFGVSLLRQVMEFRTDELDALITGAIRGERCIFWRMLRARAIKSAERRLAWAQEGKKRRRSD